MNFRLIVVSLLALSLMACGSKQETQTAKVNDPNIVELPAEMAKGITVMKVGDAEIRDLLRIPGSIQVDEQRMARIGAPVTPTSRPCNKSLYKAKPLTEPKHY